MLLFVNSERNPNSHNNADASSPTLSLTHPLEYKEEIEKLKKIFAQYQDASEAYAEFLNIYREYSDNTKNSSNIHGITHWVGAQLYYQEGMPGIEICDFSFAGGCYHGFFGQAIHNEGKEALLQAEQHCSAWVQKDPARYGECVHGFGHGVLSLYGYSYADLLNALQDCATLSSNSSSLGCYNGTFMEYNTRTMEISDDSMPNPRRPNSPEDLLEPCASLPTHYQSHCYYEQPQWWLTVFGDNFSKMANLCDTVEQTLNRENCFQGFARAIMTISLITTGEVDKQKIKEVCGQLDDQDAVHCIGEAVRSLASQGDATSTELCDSLARTDQSQCYAFGNKNTCTIFGICEK